MKTQIKILTLEIIDDIIIESPQDIADMKEFKTGPWKLNSANEKNQKRNSFEDVDLKQFRLKLQRKTIKQLNSCFRINFAESLYKRKRNLTKAS